MLHRHFSFLTFVFLSVTNIYLDISKHYNMTKLGLSMEEMGFCVGNIVHYFIMIAFKDISISINRNHTPDKQIGS